MFAFLDSPPEIILIIVVVLVLFGGSQLPKLAKNFGKAQQEFKAGLSEGQKDAQKTDDTSRGRRSHDARGAAVTRQTRTAPVASGRGVMSRAGNAVVSGFAMVVTPTLARRFRMRRRSRSLQPPHTPCSMRWSRAYSRHCVGTGQSVQILRARSTPTPSLGKNTAGG